MRLPIILFAGIALMTTSCAGPSRGPETESSSSPASPLLTAESLALGERAWSQGMCAKCHGKEATGGERAPDLTDRTWLHCDGSIEGIRGVLMTGVPEDRLADPSRPFQMNPATNLVPEAESISALAAYVWSLSR